MDEQGKEDRSPRADRIRSLIEAGALSAHGPTWVGRAPSHLRCFACGSDFGPGEYEFEVTGSTGRCALCRVCCMAWEVERRTGA